MGKTIIQRAEEIANNIFHRGKNHSAAIGQYETNYGEGSYQYR